MALKIIKKGGQKPAFIPDTDPDPKPEHMQFGKVAAQMKLPAVEKETIHQELLLDGVCRAALTSGPGALISWYLMACWAHYHRDVSLISDGLFDDLCVQLIASWEKAQYHPHAKHVDIEAVRAGTGYHMKQEDFPMLVRSAVRFLVASETGQVIDL